jgi:hypothetical protein
MSQNSHGAGQRLNSSFWTGFFMGLAAPALILTAMTKRRSPSVQQTLANDWLHVGEDMGTAIKKVGSDIFATKKVA